MELLQRAYEVDPGHAGVLLALAHLSMVRGEHDKALHLAQAAEEGVEGVAQRAQVALVRARAHHARGEMLEAKQQYIQVSWGPLFHPSSIEF